MPPDLEMKIMRPIERGEIPTDAQGQPKVFRQYKHARRDLIDRLGEYCSYCEMHLGLSNEEVAAELGLGGASSARSLYSRTLARLSSLLPEMDE